MEIIFDIPVLSTYKCKQKSSSDKADKIHGEVSTDLRCEFVMIMLLDCSPSLLYNERKG